MNKEREEHLERVINETVDLMDKKYRSGAKEHDEDLLKKDDILDESIDEAIDLLVYLLTLKEQNANLHLRKYKAKRSAKINATKKFKQKLKSFYTKGN